jgi:hypothetical protein
MGRAEIPWNLAHHRKGRPVLVGQILRNWIISQKGQASNARYNCTELAFVTFGLNESWTKVTNDVADDIDGLWLTHMSFNYRRYYGSMPPNKELIVLHTNHLWEDWEKVNWLMSGSERERPIPSWRTRGMCPGTIKQRKGGILGATWLCQLLRDEIRYYIMIMSRAINLDEDDFVEIDRDLSRKYTGL